MVEPAWFHSPPPSLVAVLLMTLVPVSVTIVPSMPDTWMPPPLPGLAAVESLSPATLLTIRPALTVTVPSTTSIPPPAREAVLAAILLSVMVTVPSTLRIPPPEPEVPSAKFDTMREFETLSVPPSL